jgi:hypothetical protein
MRHIYSDTGSGVQRHTRFNSNSQPVEIFVKFANDELANLTVEETNAYQQK